MPTLLVTGASGVVGRRLLERVSAAGRSVRVSGRMAPTFLERPGVTAIATGPVDGRTDWAAALEGCDVVVHLAAQVPAPGLRAEAFETVNDQGTARLVAQARAAGVRRFIHLSSVFAVREHAHDAPVDETTAPRPVTPYGRSKLAAEAHLRDFEGEGRKAVVLRPPAVYGPTARGNWRLLLRLAATGLPLPFGGVDNRRSLIAVDNLASAIAHLVTFPEASFVPGTYMVADADTVSLPQILALLRAGMGMPARLISVPPALVRGLLAIAGRSRMAPSLLDDLEVDARLFARTFDWRPEVAAADAIRQSGAAFRSGGA